MPKTKTQALFFTAITAWLMVYFMTLYNQVLSGLEFNNFAFLSALKGMWLEFIIIFILAYFVSSKIAKKLAFRVVNKGDRPIFIILAIQIFTVISQVFFASFLGLYHGFGISYNIVPNYILTYCRNFAMALPLQLIVVGPLARFIFRRVFMRKANN